MRILNRKQRHEGLLNRLCVNHTTRMTGLVDQQAVAVHNNRQRLRTIYRFEWELVNGRYVRKRIPVRVIYKHPAR